MPKKTKLTCAVIGAGNMGMNHIRIYDALPSVKLVAVAEPSKKPATIVAKKFKVQVYSDYEKMLENEKIDMVSICVPTSLHYEVAKKCMESKIHTLLEKPIATSLHEAQHLLK